MSQFEKVCEFNRTFGVPTKQQPDSKVFEMEKEMVSFRLSLIEEEVAELTEAIKNKDLVEVTDALADILYVVYGMGSCLGINLDKAFDIVHESNMSKACKSEDEARTTVEYYIKNKDTLSYDSPSYRLSPCGTRYVVFNASTTKVLKNVNYKPACFKEMGL